VKAGLTMTASSPRAAARSTSASASCFEFAYAIPRWAIMNGCVSSARPPFAAGPIAATEEVWTSLPTPAASASSATSLVPPTLTAKTSSRSRSSSELSAAT